MTFIGGMSDKEMIKEMRNGELVIRSLLTDKLDI